MRPFEPIDSLVENPSQYLETMARSFGDRYRDSKDSWTGDETTVSLTRKVCQRLSSFSEPEVLDVGCGKGVDAVLLRQHGASVLGVDIVAQPEWTEISERTRRKVTFIKTDFLKWSRVNRRTFDAAIDNGCFHHQHPEDRKEFLEGFYRVIKPNGILGLTVFARPKDSTNTQSGLFRLDDGRLSQEFSSEEISKLLWNSGFESVETESVSRPGIEFCSLHVICKRGS